ncbi:MAG TPA: acetyl-coenzyme A synthetase N-terminal domain-containing protein, partial [Gaiellaceae bacterium]|nr:acetyl-coenzyme A synthetase N-terminal domain-containing protein [Gaiellaceae bacterium]
MSTTGPEGTGPSAASGDGGAGLSPARAVTGENREQAIETLMAEERRYPPAPEFTTHANAKAEVYDVPFEEFWERQGRERVTWFQPFTSLLEWELPYAKWYGGGKINVTYNCLDRHVEAGLGDRVAFHYEGEPVGER